MVIDKRTLGTPLAEGGEGRIYKKNGTIFKIFKENTVDVAMKEKKIDLLLKAHFPPDIIGPMDALKDSNGKFIGYIMKDLGTTLPAWHPVVRSYRERLTN